MKVILLQDVAKIGRRYEETTVPDGYAMNMLIPRGMAQVANPENRKKVAARQAKMAADSGATTEQLQAAAEAFKASPLTITVDASDRGHMFEAVKAETIAAAAVAAGQTVSADQVVINDPIKSVGEHQISFKGADVEVKVVITVVAA